MSLVIAFLGYFFLAVVVLLDKKIVSGARLLPITYTFYSTIFLLALFVCLLFGAEVLSGTPLLYSFVSGVSFGVSLWCMFLAMKHAEASHVGPFIGACITVATFVLSSFVLDEHLSPFQQGGIALLVVSSLLLSFEKTAKGTHLNRGYVWAIVAGCLFALSHVTAKIVYESTSFLSGLVWTKGATGIFGLLLLLSPVVHRSFMHSKRNVSAKEEKKRAVNRVRIRILVVSNKVLSILANGLIQYAIAIGSVTLVNALSGVQYAFLFFMVLFLSKYYTHFFHEYMTRREIVVQTIAIVCVIIGAGLFVI